MVKDLPLKSKPMDFPQKMIVEFPGSRWEHIKLHPIVSKGMLANHFNCKITYLRKHFFSDETLQKIGISPERYKKVHSGFFTVEETEKIYNHFNIRYLMVM